MEKIVNKPWGKEIWIAYPPEHPYVMKKIYTKAGYRSSVHVHRKKMETNYVISGSALVSVSKPIDLKENNRIPEMEISEVVAGSIFHINPNQVHRVEALEDLITIEVSTTEVDDVIRLSDDTGRKDGRIESEHTDMQER